MTECGPSHRDLLDTAHGPFCIGCGQLLNSPAEDNLIVQERIEPGGGSVTPEPKIRKAPIQGHSQKRRLS
jgi:hypothetical protein